MATLESKKLKSPYAPSKEKMNDIAYRIQSNVGIAAQEIFTVRQTSFIEQKKSPVQLSVEFGAPTAKIAAPESVRTRVKEVKQAVDEVVQNTQLENETSPIPSQNELDSETKEIVLDTVDKKLNLTESDALTTQIPQRPIPPAYKIATNNAQVQESDNGSPADEHSVNEQEAVSSGAWSVQIPWGSILGFVATAMAVVGAWWVWDNIQKPSSVEDVVQTVSDQTRTATTIQPSESAVNEIPTKPALVELPAEYRSLNSLLSQQELNQVTYLDFTGSSEPSKISMVKLEKKGMIVLELEDDLFNPLRL